MQTKITYTDARVHPKTGADLETVDFDFEIKSFGTTQFELKRTLVLTVRVEISGTARDMLQLGDTDYNVSLYPYAKNFLLHEIENYKAKPMNTYSIFSDRAQVLSSNNMSEISIENIGDSFEVRSSVRANRYQLCKRVLTYLNEDQRNEKLILLNDGEISDNLACALNLHDISDLNSEPDWRKKEHSSIFLYRTDVQNNLTIQVSKMNDFVASVDLPN